MTIPTPAQLALLRTRPHQTKLWLSIYQPSTVLTARVNDASIVKGTMSVNYDGSVGDYTKIIGGMIMLVGTTTGGSEKGRVRVRSATDTVITVAENSHINWANDDYLTILNFIEINAKYPRIIQDPADETNVIFYKDYDVAYTNQNSALGAFVCMGGHYAGFTDQPVYFSASGTYSLKGEALSYSWEFPSGTPHLSLLQTPGYISYNAPGHFVAKLTVTLTGTSITEESYRYISIYDRPESGTFNPFLQWELTEFSGSREQGGYTARVKLHQASPDTTVRDGALVVIFAEDWYGDTKQSIGGNALNRSSILFAGYVLDGTINYDYQYSTIEFNVGSVSEMMKVAEGFSISVETSGSPTTWFELLDMDIRRALYHYLKWHSTVLQTTDFEFSGADKKIQYFDADRTSLYEAVESLMRGALYGDIVSDRQGKLWAEIDVAATHNAASVLPVSLDITKEFWMNEPTIDIRTVNEMSYLEMGGIAYTGVGTGTFAAFMGCAPGNAPSYRGNADMLQGLALSSQEQLNDLVGDIFAYNNSKYPSVSLDMSGNFRNLDIAPQELVTLTVMPEDTIRRLTWIEKPFALRSVSFNFMPSTNTLLEYITVSEVTAGFAGDSIPIPDVEDSGGFLDLPFDGFNFGMDGGIELYDEGNFLGRVRSLNFIGPPVEATINEYDGIVTYTSPCDCDPIALSEDFILYLDPCTTTWETGDCGEKTIGCFDRIVAGSATYYDVTNLQSQGKIVLQLSGFYIVWFDITMRKEQNNADGYFKAFGIVKHYNSVGELQDEYEFIGSITPPQIGTFYSYAQSNVFIQTTEANDYIQFYAYPDNCFYATNPIDISYTSFYIGRT